MIIGHLILNRLRKHLQIHTAWSMEHGHDNMEHDNMEHDNILNMSLVSDSNLQATT